VSTSLDGQTGEIVGVVTRTSFMIGCLCPFRLQRRRSFVSPVSVPVFVWTYPSVVAQVTTGTPMSPVDHVNPHMTMVDWSYSIMLPNRFEDGDCDESLRQTLVVFFFFCVHMNGGVLCIKLGDRFRYSNELQSMQMIA
jgi:hypothetical protein